MPCEQMGWLSWQPRAWDAQLAEGNGSRALGAPVQMPVPPEVTLGRAGTGVSGMGTGCFTPPHSAPGSCYSISKDKTVSEMLSARAPHWGQLAPATILCPPETHLESNSTAIIFLTTSARWFPVRGWLLPEVNLEIKGLKHPLPGFRNCHKDFLQGKP